MNTVDLNEVVQIVFSEPVRVDIHTIKQNYFHNVREVNGYNNLTAVIEDNTLVIKNDSSPFFRTVRFTVNTGTFLLEFNSEFLKKINFGFANDRASRYIQPSIVLKSKNLEHQYNKIIHNFIQDKSFTNARRLLHFISKFAGFMISSEFGFDGYKIRINKIFDKNYGTNISKNAEDKLYHLSQKIHTKELEVAGIQSLILKLKEERAKIQKFVK